MFKIRKTAALAALFCSSVLNAWASADHMVIAMPQIPTIIEPQGINNNAIDRYVGNVFETPSRRTRRRASSSRDLPNRGAASHPTRLR